MPLYFFDIFDGKNLSDTEGTECADLAVMEQQALRAAGEMISEETAFRRGDPWSMIVRNERRETVATIKLHALLV